jgi:S-adenosylmethionine hydrolase
VEAGFWLSRSAHYFPAGSVHLAIVDPGVGSDRNSLILKAGGHLFLAPNNGLLAAVWQRYQQVASLWRLDLKKLRGLDLGPLSATFHGRDLYAPVAAAFASGAYEPTDLGEVTTSIEQGHLPHVVVNGGIIEGIVITVDHFGNLITNIDAKLFDTVHELTVLFQDTTLDLKRTYAEGRPGELIALVNSFGVLEIAQVQGNAALEFNVGRGAKVEVRGRARG